MANPDSRYGEIMAFLEGKKQHAFNLWADSGISTRAWKKYTAKIDNQILRIVNSLRLGKSDVVPFSAGILKTRGPDTRDRSGAKLRQSLNFQSVMSGYGRTMPRRDYTSTEARQDANLIYGVGGASTGANRTGDFSYLADQEEAQKKHSDAFRNFNQSLGSWTSKRSKILSTMGDTLGEAFYEKVTNLEKSKHHWASRISLGKISREFNVRSAIGSGMHGVHGSLGGIPGFRIHTERDADDYLWFLNHKGEMTERGAYNAVRMNRSLDAQKLRRKHSKSFRDRIKAGDEAYESDLADATSYTGSQEKLIRGMAKTYSPDDLKKGQERARTVLFARNHKVLYKISQWLPKTATPLNKLAVPFQKFGMRLSGLTSIGKGLGLGVMSNPFTMGIALGLGALKVEEKFSRETDEANKKVNDWQNKLSVHGAPSKEFQAAARLAGIDDYGQIVKLHAEMQQKYGDADLGLRAIGMATGKLTRKQRSFFASSEGLSDGAMVIADILARNGRTAITKARLTEARVSANEFRQIVNRRSGSGFWSTVSSIIENPSSDARYHDANGNYIFRGEGDIFEQMKNAQESAYRAASSADEYDARKLSSTEISTSIGTITNNFYGVENSEDIIDKITASAMSASQRALSKTSSSKIG